MPLGTQQNNDFAQVTIDVLYPCCNHLAFAVER